MQPPMFSIFSRPPKNPSALGKTAQEAIQGFAQLGISVRVLPKPTRPNPKWWELNELNAPITVIGGKVYALYNGQYYEAVVRNYKKHF